MVKLNTFVKIEDPINLYHTVRHISERAKHGSPQKGSHELRMNILFVLTMDLFVACR